MQVIRQLFGGAILGLFEIVAGLLLVIDPAGTTKGILICGGIGLMVWGGIRIAGYFLAECQTAAMDKGLFHGLCLLLCGGICAKYTDWLTTRLPIIIDIYGGVIFISGLNKLQWAVNMFRLKKGKWLLAATSAAGSIIWGSLIMQNPFSSTKMLLNFTGMGLIAEAVIDLLTFLFCGSNRHRKHRSDAPE